MKLVYYGGEGFGGARENAPYKVLYSKSRLFGKLSEAREFYNGLNETKAIWDLDRMELLDAYTETE